MTATPHFKTVAYRAAELLHKSGPLPRADLSAKVQFSVKPQALRHAIDRSIETGWLIEEAGRINLGDKAREHFADEEVATPKYIGQIAAQRDPGNVYDRPQLSRKHIPNSKGTRDDVPAYSVRQAPSFRSVPTGGSQP